MPTVMIRKFVLWIVLLATIQTYAADEQWIRRAAFDIGSASTKMLVADVNIRSGEIKVIFEHAEKVDYQESVEKQGKLSDSVKDLGILVLAKMKWLALEKGATQFAGVATEAFRLAENGSNFVEFLTKVLGIQIEIIGQRKEAILGFLGAALGEEKRKQDIIVWDIGAGSMQITMANGDGEYVIYQGKLASVTLATHIIEKIQGKDIKQVASPNPISSHQVEEAIKYIVTVAKDVPKEIQEKLLQPNTLVLGIGGVHYYSIRNQVKMDKVYSTDALDEALLHKMNKTDEQIGGSYASTEVSNLALVKGFMKALQIKEVKPKKINMGHGILLYGDLWK